MNKFDEQINELDKAIHILIDKKNRKNDMDEKYPLIQGLSTLEISIIQITYNNENIILKDIVDSLNIPKSTLTSVINRLENQDIIKREKNPNDKRSYSLILTEKGKAIKKEHDDGEKEIFEKILNSLDTPQERDKFIKLISKIAKNL